MGIDDVNEVNFYGFEMAEMDSITLEVFAANTNLQERLDSLTTGAAHWRSGDTVSSVMLPGPVRKDREYRFTLHRIAKAYRISDLETVRLECNCPSDKYDRLNGYSVDGRKVSGSVLAIER